MKMECLGLGICFQGEAEFGDLEAMKWLYEKEALKLRHGCTIKMLHIGYRHLRSRVFRKNHQNTSDLILFVSLFFFKVWPFQFLIPSASLLSFETVK